MPRKTVPIMKLSKENREKLRELRKSKEQKYDESTNKACIRIPKDLYNIQKKVAKELGVTYTQLLISMMLSISMIEIKPIEKIVYNSNMKRDNLLNSVNPIEGVKFDVNTDKWVLVVRYRQNQPKATIKPTKYNTYPEAKKAWDDRIEQLQRDNLITQARSSSIIEKDEIGLSEIGLDNKEE